MLKLANQFRIIKRNQYLLGTLYPQLAVQRGWDVRVPTDLPVPTACIRIARKVTLTTGANGQLFVNYVPGTLLRSNDGAGGMASTLVVNNTCNFNGTPGSNNFQLNAALGLP